MRTFVIGDIHGGLKALEEVLSKVNLQETDTLIFLGDYVDGWSESAQVIEYLLLLEAKYNCIFIIGNHDASCRDWLEGKIPDSTWVKHGGESTMVSYQNISNERIEIHLNFFERMKEYHVDDNNNLFIHAGFSSMHGPSHETYMSNFMWDRTLWETAVAMDKH